MKYLPAVIAQVAECDQCNECPLVKLALCLKGIICIHSSNTLEKLNSSTKLKNYHVPGFPRTEDADYDYEANNDITKDDDNTIVKGNEIEVMATPKFVSAPQSVIVNEGDTVRLPCIVDRLEGFVMLWKKGADIITVASQIIDKRVRLDEDKNGNHLILGQASPKDSGVPFIPINVINVP